MEELRVIQLPRMSENAAFATCEVEHTVPHFPLAGHHGLVAPHLSDHTGNNCNFMLCNYLLRFRNCVYVHIELRKNNSF